MPELAHVGPPATGEARTGAAGTQADDDAAPPAPEPARQPAPDRGRRVQHRQLLRERRVRGRLEPVPHAPRREPRADRADVRHLRRCRSSSCRPGSGGSSTARAASSRSSSAWPASGSAASCTRSCPRSGSWPRSGIVEGTGVRARVAGAVPARRAGVAAGMSSTAQGIFGAAGTMGTIVASLTAGVLAAAEPRLPVLRDGHRRPRLAGDRARHRPAPAVGRDAAEAPAARAPAGPTSPDAARRRLRLTPAGRRARPCAGRARMQAST